MHKLISNSRGWNAFTLFIELRWKIMQKLKNGFERKTIWLNISSVSTVPSLHTSSLIIVYEIIYVYERRKSKQE